MTIENLAALVRERQPCVVLTGAGVSTESGIPDFRSPGGLWAEFDPLEYGSIEAFRADPEKVWRFYAPRFSMLTEAEPNSAHVAIAELERRGLRLEMRFGIPHGPCATFRAPGGQRLAAYELTRPRADARFEGRHDFGPAAD